MERQMQIYSINLVFGLKNLVLVEKICLSTNNHSSFYKPSFWVERSGFGLINMVFQAHNLAVEGNYDYWVKAKEL